MHPDANHTSAGALAPGRVTLLLLTCGLFAVPFFFNLPLTDPDEGLHAAIAREMAETGNWFVPRLLGVAFLDKPILFFLAQALSIAAFGSHEFAVRLPGQLFGFLGAATTGLLGWRMGNRQLGIVAACIHATLLFPMALNQAAVHDVALVPWINLAMLALALAVQQQGAGMTRYALAGLFLALAILTKGLVGVALVGIPIALITIVERRLSWRSIAGGALAVTVAFALALPWYLVMERAEPGYLRYFFIERHLLGFTTTTQLHGFRPWWYYVPVLVAGGLPWVLTLPALRPAGGWWSAPWLRLAVIWLAADLLFLSAAGSKLATYVLPLFSPLALLVAGAWTFAPVDEANRPARSFQRWIRLQTLAGAAVLIAVGTFAFVGLRVSVPPRFWFIALVVAALWLVVAQRAAVWPIARSFAACTALVVVILLGAYPSLFPRAVSEMTARDLAVYVNTVGSVPARLWVLDERIGSFLFYLQPELRHQLLPGQVEGVALGRMLTQSGSLAGARVAIPESAMPRLFNRLEMEDIPFDRAGRYRVYEAVALRNARPKSVDGAPVH